MQPSKSWLDSDIIEARRSIFKLPGSAPTEINSIGPTSKLAIVASVQVAPLNFISIASLLRR
jgi:hypothetical protein